MTDININAISEALNNKADRDINNLTNSGYAKGSGLGMPSSKYVDLELGASGTTYTAPANGYYNFGGGATSGTKYGTMNANNFSVTGFSTSGISNFNIIIPVRKGNTMTISYSVDTANILRFIYAEGEQ